MTGHLDKIHSESNEVFHQLMQLYLTRTCHPHQLRNYHTRFSQYRFVIANINIGWNEELLCYFRVVPMASCSSKSSTPLSKNKNSVFYGQPVSNLVDRILHDQDPEENEYYHLLYSDMVAVLEDIGKDIVYETSPCMTESQAAAGSTASLRVALYHLESKLCYLVHEDIHTWREWLDIVILFQKIDTPNLTQLYHLLAHLEANGWDCLDPKMVSSMEKSFGTEWLDRIHTNQLVSKMVIKKHSEKLLDYASFFGLTKILFCIFGYSRFAPAVRFSSSRVAAPARRSEAGKYTRNNTNKPCYGASPNVITSTQIVESPGYSQDAAENLLAMEDLYPILIELMGGESVNPNVLEELDSQNLPFNYEDLGDLGSMLRRYGDYAYVHKLKATLKAQKERECKSRRNPNIRAAANLHSLRKFRNH